MQLLHITHVCINTHKNYAPTSNASCSFFCAAFSAQNASVTMRSNLSRMPSSPFTKFTGSCGGLCGGMEWTVWVSIYIRSYICVHTKYSRHLLFSNCRRKTHKPLHNQLDVPSVAPGPPPAPGPRPAQTPPWPPGAPPALGAPGRRAHTSVVNRPAYRRGA